MECECLEDVARGAVNLFCIKKHRSHPRRIVTPPDPNMTTLPAYALLAVAAYAGLRRGLGLPDIALLGLLVLVGMAYVVYVRTTSDAGTGLDVASIARGPTMSLAPTPVPMPPPALGQTIRPEQPPTSRGRGTVHPPSAFTRALATYPDLRAPWTRLGRVYRDEGPVPLSQRSVLQAARDAFVDHVRALRRFADADSIGRPLADDSPTEPDPSTSKDKIPDPRLRLAAPAPRRRHPPRPISQAQRQAAVVTTYARLQNAFDGLRLQVRSGTRAARRAEVAMEQICGALEAVDTGDAYSARVPEPANSHS